MAAFEVITEATELRQILQKDYPGAMTVQGLQQLPLVWSDTTLTRIQQVLQDIQK